MHYLDANSTEKLRPAARDALLAALDLTGNPSSVHAAGRAARRVVEAAREPLANRFGCRAGDLVFTSGATEANALAIHALGAGRRLIVGATEHPAVHEAAPDRTVLPVDRTGVADLEALARLLVSGGPALVSLMLANNETGTLHPVGDAAALCRRHGALLHVDAVQAAGRIPVSLRALGVHSLALSSHKLGGAMGAGALLLAPEVTDLKPLIRGGGQERGRRGGTPPLPAIAAFAAAAAVAISPPVMAEWQASIESAAMAAGAIICGGGAARLPNTSCLALPGVRADAQVIALDLEGIAVSAGAACSSGKVMTSHVLTAMGLGPLAGQAIRVSLPWNATAADVAAFTEAYPRIAARLVAALATRAA
jgi:cysteine desulfurase